VLDYNNTIKYVRKIKVKVMVKVKFIQEQVTKTQRGGGRVEV
jgi:hypothetical protein